MVRVELLPFGRVIVLRFPPRLVLAASVLGMFAASSGTALSMPERVEDAVPIPDIAPAAQPQAQAPAPAEPVASGGPAITGAQIAALALAPARDRAAALIEEQARVEAVEAQRRAARESDSDSGEWQDLRDELREACDEGRIRGQICRTG
jgi:hypothetical protein